MNNSKTPSLLLSLDENSIKEISRTLFKELLDQGESLCLRVRGTSMGYIIQENDLITIKKTANEKLKSGDIILFNHSDHFFCHRIINCYEKNNETYYITKGDVLLQTDEPLLARQIIGKVHRINRGNKIINLSSPFARAVGSCIAFYSKSISYLYGRCGFYQQSWGNPQNSTLPIWMRRSIERALRLPIKILTSLLIITSRSHKILS
jgi:signal peptidase I